MLAAIAILVAMTGPANAQQRPRVTVTLPDSPGRETQPPIVKSEGLLAGKRVHELLRNGFPARIHYTLERWAVRRWFDVLRVSYEWDVIVRYDPLNQRYRVARLRGEEITDLGAHATLASADSAVSAPVRVRIPPPRSGERSYYALRVDVEMVSVSDLDELERWLRGELRPAIRGERGAGTALRGGARTLFVRMLGGEKLRYAAQSEKFTP